MPVGIPGVMSPTAVPERIVVVDERCVDLFTVSEHEGMLRRPGRPGTVRAADRPSQVPNVEANPGDLADRELLELPTGRAKCRASSIFSLQEVHQKGAMSSNSKKLKINFGGVYTLRPKALKKEANSSVV